jgi:hypothetical protein
MLAAPDSTPTSGTLFVGSYPGNEWFNTVPPQFAASDDYTIAAVGIGNNEAKELVDANGDKILGRTVLEVSESPTYPGYWQVSVRFSYSFTTSMISKVETFGNITYPMQ